MFPRAIFLSIVVAVLTLATVRAAPHAGDWKSVEIVSFKDFDDIEVRLDGKPCKAFLVGLRPLREAWKNKEERERLWKEVLAELKLSKLSAQVVVKQGETVGLSLNIFFVPNKRSFNHEWDPINYPYCATGWGAYNIQPVFSSPSIYHTLRQFR
jgi:hypothetical protein